MKKLDESFSLCVQSSQIDTSVKIPENKERKFCILLTWLQAFQVVNGAVAQGKPVPRDHVLSVP